MPLDEDAGRAAGMEMIRKQEDDGEELVDSVIELYAEMMC